jgi:hypothetical protein
MKVLLKEMKLTALEVGHFKSGEQSKQCFSSKLKCPCFAHRGYKAEMCIAALL